MTNTPDKSEMKAVTIPDRELWREREGDYYADSIHVTATGAVGINCGGSIIVRPLCEWHALASSRPADQVPDMVERVARALHDHEWSGQPKPESFTDGCRSYWMSAATAAIAALQAVPAASVEVGWQPIESAPKDGTAVMVFDHTKGVTIADYDCEWWNLLDGGWPVHPTHWRPLPEPPALKASGEE